MAKAAASNVVDLPPLPDIADVYEAISGTPLEGDRRGDEVLAHCLMSGHQDTNPSCYYNTDKQTFNCFGCEENGGILALVVGSGTVSSRKEVNAWFTKVGLRKPTASASLWTSVDVLYQYTDANGALVYEVGRWHNPKKFGQRVVQADGKFKTGPGCLDGVVRYPYKLVELMRACDLGDQTIYVVEGEKDVDRLRSLGLNATTNAQGAAWQWPVEWAQFFKGAAHVVVIADNDETGRKCAAHRASIIAREVPDTRIIDALPGVSEKGDVSDWFEQVGGSAAGLLRLAAEAPQASPYTPEYPEDAVDRLVQDFSDTGNGRWLVDCIGEHLMRFVKGFDDWMGYNGTVWNNRINTTMQTEIAVGKMKLACLDYNGQFKKEFNDHIDRVASMGSRRNMLEASISRLMSYSEDFDTHRNLLNLNNGTFNCATFELQPHDREDYLTLVSPVTYEAGADCPNFKRWLMAACGESSELYDYMQMLMGSCLEGNVGLRRFFFIFGPKGTGKSTFIRMLEGLLGPYACATDFAALTEGRNNDNGNGPTPALARLKGMRLVSASESKANDKLNVARIKQLIGGDKITARHLNAGFVEFEFEATLVMTGNEMPRIIGDESIWDKFKPVPFIHQIAAEDPEFEARELRPEMSGILNFAIEGLKKLRRLHYIIEDPPQVVEARNIERDEQDPLKLFLSECVALDHKARVEVGIMRELYAEWCKRMNVPALGPRALSNAMRTTHKMTTAEYAGGKTCWMGVKLTQQVERYQKSKQDAF